MAVLATENFIGNWLRYTGGTGVNAADVVCQPTDISRYDTFTFASTAGAVAVFATLDGTNFMTSAMAMEDLGAASTTGSVLVTVTAAERIYRIRGSFQSLQFQQSGATGVTAFTLLCSKLALQGF